MPTAAHPILPLFPGIHIDVDQPTLPYKCKQAQSSIARACAHPTIRRMESRDQLVQSRKTHRPPSAYPTSRPRLLVDPVDEDKEEAYRDDGAQNEIVLVLLAPDGIE